MSAFNGLNGVPASANAFLMRQILRNEWKFDGFVVSDYTAIHELIAHGYAADAADAAFKEMRGGVEMEMVSTDYWDHGKASDAKLLDSAVRDILRVKFRLGLFDAKGQFEGAPAVPSTSAALETARRLAAESLVLLKNQGVLPLPASVGRVVVAGPLADSPVDQLGSWAADGSNTATTPLTALRNVLGTNRVAYAPAAPAALEAARSADVVLLFLGEQASLSGEAGSRVPRPSRRAGVAGQPGGTGGQTPDSLDGFLDVVRDDQDRLDREFLALPEPDQLAAQVRRGEHVQGREGLVHQQRVRLDGPAPGRSRPAGACRRTVPWGRRIRSRPGRSGRSRAAPWRAWRPRARRGPAWRVPRSAAR